MSHQSWEMLHQLGLGPSDTYTTRLAYNLLNHKGLTHWRHPPSGILVIPTLTAFFPIDHHHIRTILCKTSSPSPLSL
ncbi:hypothetical protein RJT34_17056 [Clitoria ternatea]|uniref:Uncharacterized protein n=1 Tax=Clitoria ternatea TaxID=43366 RepID=A0AAN9J8I9_CLITE